MGKIDAARVLRLAWGLALVSVPDRIIGLICPPTHGAEVTARVLGARHLLMVPMMGGPHDRIRRGLCSTVDALHAASMVLFADLDASQRVLAGADAAAATSMGVLTLLA